MNEGRGAGEMVEPKRLFMDIANVCVEGGALDAANALLRVVNTLDGPSGQRLAEAMASLGFKYHGNAHCSPPTRLYAQRLELGLRRADAIRRLGDKGRQLSLSEKTLADYETDASKAQKAPVAHLKLFEKLYSQRWEWLSAVDRG